MTTRIERDTFGPLEVPADLSSDEIDAWRDRVRDALVAATAEAAAAVGREPEVPDADPLSSR